MAKQTRVRAHRRRTESGTTGVKEHDRELAHRQACEKVKMAAAIAARDEAEEAKKDKEEEDE